jgi:hypothetical protein
MPDTRIRNKKMFFPHACTCDAVVTHHTTERHPSQGKGELLYGKEVNREKKPGDQHRQP